MKKVTRNELMTEIEITEGALVCAEWDGDLLAAARHRKLLERLKADYLVQFGVAPVVPTYEVA